MSLPKPEPTAFDNAAAILDSCKPQGTQLSGIAIVQSGAEPEWSANYTTTTFPAPTLANIPRARRVFQRSAPPGSIVGVVSVCIIKPGGLVITKWQVHYLVRDSNTDSDESYEEPPSPPDRHWSDEDKTDEETRQEDQLSRDLTEAKTQLTRTTLASKKMKANKNPKHRDAKQGKRQLSVRFVQSTQHTQQRSDPEPKTDKKYIRLAKVAHKYPTQDHLDAALIHITKQNLHTIPARIIPYFSKAKAKVYYCLRRLQWKSSRGSEPAEEQRKLEEEGIRLRNMHEEMAIKTGFNAVASHPHPSEVCAAIHHLVEHHKKPKVNATGNSTMSSVCAWAQTTVGPLRLTMSTEYLTRLLESLNTEFKLDSEVHDIYLDHLATTLKNAPPRECISYRLT